MNENSNWGKMYFTNDPHELNMAYNNENFVVLVLDDDDTKPSKYDIMNPETGKTEKPKNVFMMSVMLPKTEFITDYINNNKNLAFTNYANYLMQEPVILSAIAAIYKRLYTGENIIFYSPVDNKMIMDFIVNCFFTYFDNVYATVIGTYFNPMHDMYMVADNAKDIFLYNPVAKGKIMDIMYYFDSTFPFEIYCLEFPSDCMMPSMLAMSKLSVKTGITPSSVASSLHTTLEEAGKYVPQYILNAIRNIKADVITNIYGQNTNNKTMPILFVNDRKESNPT